MPTRKPLMSRGLAVAALVLSALAGAFQAPAGAQAACTVSASDEAVDAEEQKFLGLLNQYRAQRGLNALILSTGPTNRAAAWFSRDMASKNYTPGNHVDSNGRNIDQRLAWCGVPWRQYAENIYWGFPDAQAAFDWWRNSPTHNSNMLAAGVTHAGIARAFDAASTFRWYWTLDLTATTPTVAGAAFYSDGTSSRTGPSGARVSVFATSAEPGFSYRLVSGRTGNSGRPCTADVVVMSDADRFATAERFIGQSAGTVNRPPGTWQICFLAEEAVTGAVTYTVAG